MNTIKAATLFCLCSLTINAWPINLDKHDKNYSIRYSYSNNKIIYRTVCADYPKGSIEYRGCRGQAQDYFKEQCTEYRQLYRTTNGTSKKQTKNKRDMFCLAKSQYNPLR
ncbi:hypothetical protein ACH42_00545 [Endozoicomonas sp. (ex Bugula neritina AB1)]|nr:hypothetical protein ACH42_00545 [Endozoicomonas sp. (ex Bugula neritina AB1)]